MVNMSVPKSTATNLASTDPVRSTLLHLVAIPATFSCENKSDPDFQRHGQTKRARGRGGAPGGRRRGGAAAAARVRGRRRLRGARAGGRGRPGGVPGGPA